MSKIKGKKLCTIKIIIGKWYDVQLLDPTTSILFPFTNFLSTVFFNPIPFKKKKDKNKNMVN